jgi:hypothetical protein
MNQQRVIRIGPDGYPEHRYSEEEARLWNNVRSVIPPGGILHQSRGSDICGQACLAMIAGCGIDEAIAAVGHDRDTDPGDLYRGMRALGVRYRRIRPMRWGSRPVDHALLDIWLGPGDNDGHWVVWWGGRVYDPDPDVAWPFGYEGLHGVRYIEVRRMER